MQTGVLVSLYGDDLETPMLLQSVSCCLLTVHLHDVSIDAELQLSGW